MKQAVRSTLSVCQCHFHVPPLHQHVQAHFQSFVLTSSNCTKRRSCAAQSCTSSSPRQLPFDLFASFDATFLYRKEKWPGDRTEKAKERKKVTCCLLEPVFYYAYATVLASHCLNTKPLCSSVGVDDSKACKMCSLIMNVSV